MSTHSTHRPSALRELIRRPYFWGVIAIALLLLINSIKDPGYLAVSYNSASGNLVGNLIDILRAAAPIAMISVGIDRKSTRLNSSHVAISYAVFCLKKKTNVIANHDR